MSNIDNNIQNIKTEIKHYKSRLIAVSKYVGINEIINAYHSGIRDFAESKAQDAESKRNNLNPLIETDIIWHFIGHVQTNKTKKIVGKYQYIHSVDSMKLAKAISQEAKEQNIIQKILIQVNITGEKTKYGFTKNELMEEFKEIKNLENIEITGLMTMAEYTLNDADLRITFKSLNSLKNEIQDKFNCLLPELSMGMSNDYKIALEEGSTMIRIGSKIFKN